MTASARRSVLAAAVALALATPALAQNLPTSEAEVGRLETIVVTAQKREVDVQASPLAVTAISGATLQAQKITTVEDLGHSVVGLSFTATSPQAQEINIRGVVNTRLIAPTADQSVSTFVDEVYVGRSGTLNPNFYDVERIEVIRGPQGVLLGKNVAGGAVSVISAGARTTPEGGLTLTAGNYGLKQATGFVTGPLGDAWSGRLAFQSINNDGWARDLVHGVKLEDLRSIQGRGTLRYAPSGSDFVANLIVDYSQADSNGPNRVPVASPNGLPGPALQPWSKARPILAALYGGVGLFDSWPTWPQFKGDLAPTPQDTFRNNRSGILRLEKGIAPNVALTSVTGFRGGWANTFYDQSGIGPTNPGNVDVRFLFAEPVYFAETIRQYSEELRVASTDRAARLDWIAGVYWQQTKVTQDNRYWGETKYLPTLSGESHWTDPGKTQTYAVFAQVGVKFTDAWKLDLGVRWTNDKKSGTQTGTATSTASRFDPADRAPLTPLAVLAFSTPYSQSWSKVTPQATLTFKPSDSFMTYLTLSEGFKGGGFQNNAPNAFAAATPYNPESVRNYELGFKSEFLDHTLRLNTSIFYMKYKDLQVQQTSGACLCNIINNASSATIKGIESEFQWFPVRALQLWVSASYLDDKYDQFIDTNGVNNTGKRLQRTPDYQASVGTELTTPLGAWPDALRIRLSYKQQGKMYWAPDNFTWEDSFGLLDGRIAVGPPDAKWSVAVWGRNLTNKVYRTSIIAIFGDEISSYGAPRTYGADVSFRF